MRRKTNRIYRHFVSLTCLFLLLPCMGCFVKKTPAVPVNTSADFSFSDHSDGSAVSAEEAARYGDKIVSELMISSDGNKLTGTSVGLFSTVVSVSLYNTADRALLSSCFQKMAVWETVFSRTLVGSELYRLNHKTGDSFEMSPMLSRLFSAGLPYYELSEHRLDFSIAPLSDLWDFSGAAPHVPAPSEIANALTLTGSENVRLVSDTLLCPAGMQFDLGAVAKGYLADLLAEYLNPYIADGTISGALINLGGNTLALGRKSDGSAYRIGIAKPFCSSGELAGSVQIEDMSVVTSGIYERCFVEDGVLYHHILDASTGYPVKTDLLSVTVICENSQTADALSTTLFLLGKEKGTELIRSLNSDFPVYAMFISGQYLPDTGKILNYQVSFTDGFENDLAFRPE